MKINPFKLLGSAVAALLWGAVAAYVSGPWSLVLAFVAGLTLAVGVVSAVEKR